MPEIVQDLAPGMLVKAMGLMEAKHGQFKGISGLALAQEVLFPMADYIDAVLKRIKGLPGGEELLNFVSLQDMIDEPMAKLILEAMDRAPSQLHEKSTETSGYARRMSKAAAGTELCLSCGDPLLWDSEKGTYTHGEPKGWAGHGPWTGSQRLCPARNNACRACKGFREALGVTSDAALPGSACHGVLLCPIARHGRNLRRLGKFLKDKENGALSPVRALQPKRKLRAEGAEPAGGVVVIFPGGKPKMK